VGRNLSKVSGDHSREEKVRGGGQWEKKNSGCGGGAREPVLGDTWAEIRAAVAKRTCVEVAQFRLIGGAVRTAVQKNGRREGDEKGVILCRSKELIGAPKRIGKKA